MIDWEWEAEKQNERALADEIARLKATPKALEDALGDYLFSSSTSDQALAEIAKLLLTGDQDERIRLLDHIVADYAKWNVTTVYPDELERDAADAAAEAKWDMAREDAA